MEEALIKRKKITLMMSLKESRNGERSKAADLARSLPLLDISLGRVQGQRRYLQGVMESCIGCMLMHRADETQFVSLGHFSLAIDKRFEIHQSIASRIYDQFLDEKLENVHETTRHKRWDVFLDNIHQKCHDMIHGPSEGDFDLSTPSCFNPQPNITDMSSEIRLPLAQVNEKKRKRSLSVEMAQAELANLSSDEEAFVLDMKKRSRARQKLSEAIPPAATTEVDFPSIPIMDSAFLAGVSASQTHVSETPDHSSKTRSPLLETSMLPSQPVPPNLRKDLTSSPQRPNNDTEMDEADPVKALFSPSEFHKGTPIITSTRNPLDDSRASIGTSMKATQNSDSSRTTAGDQPDVMNMLDSSPLVRKDGEKIDHSLLATTTPDRDWIESEAASKDSMIVNRSVVKRSVLDLVAPLRKFASVRTPVYPFNLMGKENNRPSDHQRTLQTAVSGPLALVSSLPSLTRSRSWTYASRPPTAPVTVVLDESHSLTNSPPKESGDGFATGVGAATLQGKLARIQQQEKVGRT
ncbi:hypothetical protein BC829DRAFT_397663 [Chytridium lagenaria]|nr:hypothetical protein BC829DRAFT_397663 [Chytridium lagenaria]